MPIDSYKCLPSKPGWRRADWLCCVSTLNLVLNLFKQYLRRDPSWCDDEGNKCLAGASGWSSDLHTLSICYHRDSAHINIFIFTLTRQGLQPHAHIWPHNGDLEKSQSRRADQVKTRRLYLFSITILHRLHTHRDSYDQRLLPKKYIIALWDPKFVTLQEFANTRVIFESLYF